MSNAPFQGLRPPCSSSAARAASGSIAIQIARQRTDLTVIATASRAETVDWVRSLGAHHVIDHSKPLAAQIAGLGLGAPGFVFSTTHTQQHATDVAELIAPQGRFALIDDPQTFDIMAFKRKAVSIHHELMFTRSIFETPDMAGTGRDPGLRRRSRRCRAHSNHPDRAEVADQRGQSEAGARAARKRNRQRENRPRRLLNVAREEGRSAKPLSGPPNARAYFSP
jgi:NADPH:quinone reductase-like Zn-dependent oxidoreductase